MLCREKLLFLSMVRISGGGFLKLSLGTRCRGCGEPFLILESSPMLGGSDQQRCGF